MVGAPRRLGRAEVLRKARCKMLKLRDLCGGRGVWPREWAIWGRNPLGIPRVLLVELEPLVLPLGLPVLSFEAMDLYVAAAFCADVVESLTLVKMVTTVPPCSQ